MRNFDVERRQVPGKGAGDESEACAGDGRPQGRGALETPQRGGDGPATSWEEIEVQGLSNGQNNAPPKMSMSSSLEPVTVSPLRQRDFTGVRKLRILRWGGCPGLSGWAQPNHHL